MLTERKLRRKVEELNQQKLYNFVEWTDGLHYRLSASDKETAILWIDGTGDWKAVMRVER